jgi:hypothetical protein
MAMIVGKYGTQFRFSHKVEGAEAVVSRVISSAQVLSEEKGRNALKNWAVSRKRIFRRSRHERIGNSTKARGKTEQPKTPAKLIINNEMTRKS